MEEFYLEKNLSKEDKNPTCNDDFLVKLISFYGIPLIVTLVFIVIYYTRHQLMISDGIKSPSYRLFLFIIIIFSTTFLADRLMTIYRKDTKVCLV